MRWRDLQREIAASLQTGSEPAGKRPIVFVDVERQLLYRVHSDATDSRRYPVSTAARGVGNRRDSFMTPTGIHRIHSKIGGGEPRGTIFEARVATGRLAQDLDNREKDEITSRILWLDGLEPGVNLDGDCDTLSRYIYIHGTSDEQRIGRPVSAGCIRMRNDDVIELFDEVQVDDLVVIR